MKRWSNIVIIFVLSFSVIFAGLGYSALTDELGITGELMFVIPEFDEVIIRSIDSVATTGSAEAYMSDAWQVFPTNLVSTQTFGAVNDSVTYKIIAINKSNTIKYAYSNIICDAAAEGYDNAYCGNGLSITVAAASGYNLDDGIAPGETFVFTATYRLTDAALVGQEIKTIINYQFGVHVESAGDAVINSAAEQFEKIINTPESLSALQELMEANSGNTTTGGYVGNVAGSASGDSAKINQLFTDENGNNTLTITTTDGTQTDVTCIIKSETVTVGGVSKDALVIYMTAEEISGSLFNPATLEVYALVYVPGYTQDWVPLGEMYVGTATSNNYEASWFGQHNSFNTDTWQTTAYTYTVDGATYSYSLQEGLSIDEVLSQSCTELAWSTFMTYKDMADAINLDNYVDGEVKNALIYAKQHADKLTEQGFVATTQAEAVVVISDLVKAIRPFQT